ncbi:chemotaxis protein CheW [Fischerella sp. PCC 9605]|uniref:chemotaxis protein CheW n=1 Tax=Fischerella sp. PCC 9605 TaxID=1173024 RepID=UPI0004ACBB0E|nr:chemotaxis protein CheW [Fischerella sp. PCC 9605]
MKTIHDESKLEKFIAFTVADYRLALPIKAVLKVVTCPPKTDRKLSKMGLIQVSRYMIRVLDLHQHLGLEDLRQLPDQPFLVITPNSQGELCGIPVCEPPDLIELPLETIRQLPQSYRQSGVLEIASHAIAISQQEITTTIFLLDMPQVLKCFNQSDDCQD